MSRNISHRIAWKNILLLIAFSGAFFNITSAKASGETLDATFGTNGIVTTDYGGTDSGSRVLLQPDGKILTLGSMNLTGSNTLLAVVTRYTATGTMDNTFGTNGKLVIEVDGFSGCDIDIQTDGKLIVAGQIADDFAALRYSNNGSNLDNTFGTNGVTTIPWDEGNASNSRWHCSDLAIGSNGKIVMVGTETSNSVHSNLAVGSLNEDGTLDFRTLITEGDFMADAIFLYGSAVAIQPDGKILLSSHMQDSENKSHISLVRRNADGSTDTTFGSNGHGTVKIALDYFFHADGAMFLDGSGKITVAGTVFSQNQNGNENDLALARFNTDGTLDSGFGTSGITITNFGGGEIGTDIIAQPDGKMLVSGKILNGGDYDALLVRYNSNGLLDTTFGTDGKITTNFGSTSDSVNALVSQSDGKVVIVGSANGNAILARYNLIPNTNPPTSITFKSTGAQDGLILETAENSNKGGTVDTVATTLNVGDNQKDWQYRGFLSFNTATLPDNATITSARLRVKRQGLVGVNPFTTSGDLLVDISNKAFGTNANLIAGDFNAPATAGAIQEKFLPTASPWYSVDLNNANLAFINKYGLTQFRLRFSVDDNDNLKADYLKLFTGNAPSASQPQLIITYSLP